jgi:hypothetical protein
LFLQNRLEKMSPTGWLDAVHVVLVWRLVSLPMTPSCCSPVDGLEISIKHSVKVNPPLSVPDSLVCSGCCWVYALLCMFLPTVDLFDLNWLFLGMYREKSWPWLWIWISTSCLKNAMICHQVANYFRPIIFFYFLSVAHIGRKYC